MNDLRYKFKELVDGKQIRIRPFARKLNISPTTIYNFMDGKSVNETTLKGIETEVTRIEGLQTDEAKTLEVFQEISHPESYTYIPVYNVTAVGGHGAVVEDEKIIDSLAFKRAWINQELLANREDLFLIHMEGESMEPTLHAKDMLLIDRRDDRFSRESIYVIREGEMLLVKRVRQKGPGLVELISDNPKYEPREINVEKIGFNGFQIIGRVVWIGRRI